jgi:hypothetical protein
MIKEICATETAKTAGPMSFKTRLASGFCHAALMAPGNKNEIKRQKIVEHKEEILRIVNKMLDKDAHLNYEYYDLYKDTFYTFSKDVIDKTTMLRTPNIVFDIQEVSGIDKTIFLKPKPKTIIELMKKI